MKESLEARENLAVEWAVELWHHNPTKIARNKRHSQVLNVSNQMGNRPDRTGTIGVDRPGNQICHILIKIQSLSPKKKRKKDSIFISKKWKRYSKNHPAIIKIQSLSQKF